MKSFKNRLTINFFVTLVALVCLIIGNKYMNDTYAVFKYTADRWMVVTYWVAVWALSFILINSLLRPGDKPFAINPILFAIAVFCLVLTLVYFIKPCISPIAIWYTVRGMGDVATNAVGVPLSIKTAVYLFVALILTVIASFVRLKKPRRLINPKKKA